MGSWCNMKECTLSHMPSSKANFKNVENWKVLKMWGLLKQYVYYEDLMSVLKYHLCWLRNSTVKLSDGTIWLCALSCMTSSIANYKKTGTVTIAQNLDSIRAIILVSRSFVHFNASSVKQRCEMS